MISDIYSDQDIILIKDLEKDFEILKNKKKEINFPYDIIYINLENSNERKNRIENVSKELNIKFKRFNAVNGKKLIDKHNFLIDNKLIKKEVFNNNLNLFNGYKKLNYSSIGIALSHYFIWKDIIKKNEPKLILEDDVFFRSNFYESLNKSYELLNSNSDVDIIYLGNHGFYDEYWDFVDSNFKKLKKNNGVFGLYSMIVTPNGAKKLINLYPIDLQIDSIISSNSNNINIYRICPCSVYSFPSQNKIDDKYKYLKSEIQIGGNLKPNYDIPTIDELNNDFNLIKYDEELSFPYEIIYINLEKAIERRNRMNIIFKKINIKVNRFNAILGKSYEDNHNILINNNLIKKEALKNNMKKNKYDYNSLNYSAIGVALSHYSLWKKILEDNKPKLILEDDIFLRSNFKFSLNKCYDFLSNNENIDIIFLGHHHYWGYENSTIVNEHFIKLESNRGVFGLFSMIVTPNGAKKLVNMFPIQYQLDKEIDLNKKNLNIFRFYPNSVYSFPSEIIFDSNRFLNSQIQDNQEGGKKYLINYSNKLIQNKIIFCVIDGGKRESNIKELENKLNIKLER